MNFRQSGIPGATLHARLHMPELSPELKAAFPVNSSSFYTQQVSQGTAAGVIHVLMEEENKED